MKKLALIPALVCVCALSTAAQKPTKSAPANASKAATSNNTKIARGEYLVNGVGMCGDCHSPRDQKGALIPDQHLHGAPVGFTPSVPMPWANKAPALAGHDERLVVALLTGKARMRPPMPEYRLTQEDAEAVAAYLKSLPKPPALK